MALASVLALAAALAATACAKRSEPVRVSRDALGTIVTVTAYPAVGRAEDARKAVGAAYDAMAEVERQLDAQDASSAVAAFNRDPYVPQELPPDAVEVTDAVRRLGVGEWFSPALLGVLKLYGFETGGRVPAAPGLQAEVAAARTFGPVFARPAPPAPTGKRWSFGLPGPGPSLPPPGLDFGGAAKGLALDDAARIMREAAVPAALLSAGSTTVTFGVKPGGEPWRVGVENPRDTGKVIATITAERGVVVSTSGDYQRFFEHNGVRYHHILDPRTGLPARGLRSLTVLGDISGLDSDILSTALFVAGREKAEDYAREHGLGLVTVDDAGELRVVQPEAAGVRIETSES